jgi:hypothetical protein
MSKSLPCTVVLKRAARSFQVDLIEWDTMFVQESSRRKVLDDWLFSETKAKLSYGGSEISVRE